MCLLERTLKSSMSRMRGNDAGDDADLEVLSVLVPSLGSLITEEEMKRGDDG